MNTVQPIRDKEVIAKFKRVLMKRNKRDYIMFIIGINTGLRISDILKLRVIDFKNSHIIIREQKTNKAKRFYINDMLRKEVMEYVEERGLSEEDFIIKGRGDKAISRIQAYRILNDVAEGLGIDEIGTHTLRKTFGYWHYKQYNDIELLQTIFNHSSSSVTLRYIGITQDSMDNSVREFYL